MINAHFDTLDRHEQAAHLSGLLQAHIAEDAATSVEMDELERLLPAFLAQFATPASPSLVGQTQAIDSEFLLHLFNFIEQDAAKKLSEEDAHEWRANEMDGQYDHTFDAGEQHGRGQLATIIRTAIAAELLHRQALPASVPSLVGEPAAKIVLPGLTQGHISDLERLALAAHTAFNTEGSNWDANVCQGEVVLMASQIGLMAPCPHLSERQKELLIQYVGRAEPKAILAMLAEIRQLRATVAGLSQVKQEGGGASWVVTGKDGVAHLPNHDGLVFIRTDKGCYGIAMLSQGGCGWIYGEDWWDYEEITHFMEIPQSAATPTPAATAEPAPLPSRVGGGPEGDGGSNALQELAEYCREAGHYDALENIRAAAHNLGWCIASGGADQIEPTSGVCPRCDYSAEPRPAPVERSASASQPAPSHD